MPEGADVGGVFQRTPVCRAADQTGCVVAYATYRDTEPPTEMAFFGNPAEGEAICNHPASLAGGAAMVDPYLPQIVPDILSAFIGNGPGAYAEADASAAIDTPFFSLPDFIEAECVKADGFHYLETRIQADPDDPRADDIGGDFMDGWGLHLVDVSLLMGDLVRLAESQSAAWLAR